MTVFENDGVAVVQIERSEPIFIGVSINVTTSDGTAIGKICDIQVCNYCADVCFDLQLMWITQQCLRHLSLYMASPS